LVKEPTMQNQTREARAEAAPAFLPWDMQPDMREGLPGGATLWLTGGASLLLWTAIALLLTTA
jgi:hypothetical protein